MFKITREEQAQWIRVEVFDGDRKVDGFGIGTGADICAYTVAGLVSFLIANRQFGDVESALQELGVTCISLRGRERAMMRALE